LAWNRNRILALPAHKFTRANDFNRLTALLRNFGPDSFAYLEEDAPAPRLRRTAQNPCNERNISPAKRTFRSTGRKSLKSFSAPNQDFVVLFVFNGLTSFSFRASL
jgi:hypothetical protein